MKIKIRITTALTFGCLQLVINRLSTSPSFLHAVTIKKVNNIKVGVGWPKKYQRNVTVY
jgi:hypothetical protein